MRCAGTAAAANRGGCRPVRRTPFGRHHFPTRVRRAARKFHGGTPTPPTPRFAIAAADAQSQCRRRARKSFHTGTPTTDFLPTAAWPICESSHISSCAWRLMAPDPRFTANAPCIHDVAGRLLHDYCMGGFDDPAQSGISPDAFAHPHSRLSRAAWAWTAIAAGVASAKPAPLPGALRHRRSHVGRQRDPPQRPHCCKAGCAPAPKPRRENAA